MTASTRSTHSRETPGFYNFYQSTDFWQSERHRISKKDVNILSALDDVILLPWLPASTKPSYRTLRPCSKLTIDSSGVKHIYLPCCSVLLIICITIWSLYPWKPSFWVSLSTTGAYLLNKQNLHSSEPENIPITFTVDVLMTLLVINFSPKGVVLETFIGN